MSNSKSIVQTIKEDIGAAFMLLTRIPVNWQKISPDKAPDLNRCLWAYPLVGLAVSIIGAGVYWGFSELNVPQIIAVLLSLVSMILATGAFHEDGLADVADGFGGGDTAEKKMAIMRDSRIGTYGALALVLSIGLKLTSLASLTSYQLMTALVIGAMISRLMIIVALLILPPARKDSLSSEAGKPSLKSLLIAVIISLLTATMLLELKFTIILFVVAIVVTAAVCRLAYKQVGGFSGDILGAVQQISEISIFIALATLWGNP